MTTWLVMYAMIMAGPALKPRVYRIPMSAATCERVNRYQQRIFVWPITECMPGNWKVGEPLPWDTRYQEDTKRNVCPNEPEKCA